jgi:hypothetical protein
VSLSVINPAIADKNPQLSPVTHKQQTTPIDKRPNAAPSGAPRAQRPPLSAFAHGPSNTCCRGVLRQATWGKVPRKASSTSRCHEDVSPARGRRERRQRLLLRTLECPRREAQRSVRGAAGRTVEGLVRYAPTKNAPVARRRPGALRWDWSKLGLPEVDRAACGPCG